MKRSFRIKTWVLGVLVITDSACHAQYLPAASMQIDSVQQAGIYRIVLPPAFVAQCRPDLSDLRIHDQDNKDAAYVLKAGLHDPMNAGFLPVPDPRILQQDSSDRNSYYWLQYDGDYRIDRLSLVIIGPPLYKREAEVSAVAGEWTATPAASISIDPADSVFDLRNLRAKRLLIKVANHDNAPLKIVRVATAQSGIYLLAYLQPGHEYRLMAGNANAGAPDYDLHYFTDSANVRPPTIGLGPLHHVSVTEAASDEYTRQNRRATRSRYILWSIVTTILLLLIYVSVKLARAVDQRQEE